MFGLPGLAGWVSIVAPHAPGVNVVVVVVVAVIVEVVVVVLRVVVAVIVQDLSGRTEARWQEVCRGYDRKSARVRVFRRSGEGWVDSWEMLLLWWDSILL